jgi:hypothetical protein
MLAFFAEMLRANLALKIKSSKFDENLENLSSNDFNNIALAYCQQVIITYILIHKLTPTARKPHQTFISL